MIKVVIKEVDPTMLSSCEVCGQLIKEKVYFYKNGHNRPFFALTIPEAKDLRAGLLSMKELSW